MAIHLPLRDIPVRIALNARTPSASPLAHLTPPHPLCSDVQVREDREKKPSDYEPLTVVHQVTGKGKEVSGGISTVAVPSAFPVSSLAPCPAGPNQFQFRSTFTDWCQPRKVAVNSSAGKPIIKLSPILLYQNRPLRANWDWTHP